MDNNINTLDELNKGCTMGITALNCIIEKVEEESFRKLLDEQLIEYKDFSTRIYNLYKNYTSSEIHDVNPMGKVMTWYGIQKDTMMDDSISNLADLLIRGTNMGIIEGKKILNNKTLDKKVHKICSEYINMQEAYVEKLKKYL